MSGQYYGVISKSRLHPTNKFKTFKPLATAAGITALLTLSFSASLQADEAAADLAADKEVEVIKVTARRREENVQDVPISISVVTAKDLEQTGTYSTEQLTRLQPSLQLISSNPRNTALTIRGLGSVIGLTNDGLESGVGIYVDEVYYARPGSAVVDLLDIERVEVLRGPQGTLFGKNTTAGALSLTTGAPTFTPQGRAELSLGEDGFLQGKTTVSGALVDGKVAGRFSASSTQRDGTLYNVTLGTKQNDTNSQALRGQLLFTPSDDVDVRVSADYAYQNPNANTQVFVRYGPTGRSAASQFPALAELFDYAPPSQNPYDRLVDVNSPIQARQIIRGTSATVNWDLGDIAFTSISALRSWDWTPQNDRDYTALAVRTKSNNPSVQDQWSQEFRLASTGQNDLDWVVGLYGFGQDIETTGTEQWGSDGAKWLIRTAVPENLLDSYTSNTKVYSDTDSYAIFAQATYHLSDELRITPGVRYTREEKSGDFTQIVSGGLETTDPALISAKNGIARNQAYQADFKDSSPTGQLNIAYDLTEDHLTYLNIARGYKSGGINAAGIPTDSTGAPSLVSAVIEPEKSTTVEVGLKSQFLDRHVTLNLAVYDTKVTDYQANVVDSGPGSLRGYLANIEEVSVRGIEIDSRILVNEFLSAYFTYAYTDGQYDSFKNGPPPLEFLTGTTAAFDLSGRDLPGVSKNTGSLGGEYVHPATLSTVSGELYFAADVSYRSKWNSDSSVSRYLEVDGSTLTNLRLGFRTDGGTDVSLYARNAFDEDYLSFLSIQAGNSGAIYGHPGDPRNIGLRVKTEF
ncbi:TonB-dependent receptor [Rheinheimera soli]|uniref:TonB-dependent receptor n=1 Tax=Rheinheimera soli TaxID=443616 RepID=UPI001E2CE084|nr:TonB-dependent receptor [Rheinheimera soli]